jgi:hypothetical protein
MNLRSSSLGGVTVPPLLLLWRVGEVWRDVLRLPFWLIGGDGEDDNDGAFDLVRNGEDDEDESAWGSLPPMDDAHWAAAAANRGVWPVILDTPTTDVRTGVDGAAPPVTDGPTATRANGAPVITLDVRVEPNGWYTVLVCGACVVGVVVGNGVITTEGMIPLVLLVLVFFGVDGGSTFPLILLDDDDGDVDDEGGVDGAFHWRGEPMEPRRVLLRGDGIPDGRWTAATLPVLLWLNMTNNTLMISFLTSQHQSSIIFRWADHNSKYGRHNKENKLALVRPKEMY